MVLFEYLYGVPDPYLEVWAAYHRMSIELVIMAF